MMDDLLLGGQVLCLSLVDITLAGLCGLLASVWIVRGAAPAGAVSTRRPLRWLALVLLFALCSQFGLLAMTMTGQSAFGAIIQSLPAVASTHAGRVTVSMLFLSGLLAAIALLDRCIPARIRNLICGVTVAAILFFHAALGHASSDGDFSRAELLQFLHLGAMALWSGGIFVAALWVLPRLADVSSSPYTVYLRRLSNTSAWSASIAVVTGALKGWIAIDAKLGNLAQPGWSRVLLAKLFLVSCALVLGFLHRRKVHAPERTWNTVEKRSLTCTLRIEAFCLASVVLFSAWLSSVEPPG